MARINIPELKKAVVEHLPVLIKTHLPNATKVSGGWRIGDLDGTKGKSTFIDEESGAYFDHASGEKGGIFDLIQLFCGDESFIGTAKWAATQVGYQLPTPPRRRETSLSGSILPECTEAALAYIEGRGLDVGLAKKLPIRGLREDKGLALLHLDESGEACQAIKFYDYNLKQWSSSRDPAHVLWPLNYIHEEFAEFADYIVITEGHWDAMAYLGAGIPAVSIPSGATNDHWIEECLDFIASFRTIILSFDSDEPGRDATQRVAARLSALLGPPRIIIQPDGCKDANDTLVEHGVEALQGLVEASEPFSPPEILSGGQLLSKAVLALNDAPFQQSTPFSNFDFHYRSHESTLYTGHTGHGKSNLVTQILAHLIETYQVGVGIASFESRPETILADILRHQMGTGISSSNPHARGIADNVHIYDSSAAGKDGNNAAHIIDLFTHLHLRWGVTHFVIDNLMTLDVGREDFEGIVNIAELIRQFVILYPIHLHLVAHPRKPPGGTSTPTAPNPWDIRGPSEIADLAFNILSVLRNIEKERQLQKMLAQGADEVRIIQFDADTQDGMLVCHKQRATGKLPSIPLWYEMATSTFKISPKR